MITTPEQNLAAAVAYLRGYDRKDPDEIARYLHPEVRYSTPVAQMTGKAALAEAASRFSATLNGLTVRAKFAAGEQVMLAYDVEAPEPIGVQHAAALITFRDGLIAEMQVYFDPRPFAPAKR
ncbi:nuclear transport factor 2 family protein [Anaeromyxobacter sp. Fw109-5]|uniref:nuclear transport factor 2 family protein n=1 Tax=Anaeromyxobacter sp. (strain Fw109-5) TaxID=404589 RepID=UPI0000ED6D05|nr:nuclear transport factor 2 family protein [Anaeromyxobacter sp. Fw109-5]ABS28585.1 hypothetical protein Anae109_4407 [Anaeromyxobacter sp. Fw109-5]